MPIVTGAETVREIYRTLSEAGRAMPAYCTENRRTTLAILEAARRVGEDSGKPDLPVVIAFTASYPLRPQLKLYAGTGDLKHGIACLRSDVEALTAEGSGYSDLRVLLHLDHAQPEEDRPVVEALGDRLASVMWDGSHYPMDRNMEYTAAFVREYGDRFLVEGAVDEIPESGDADSVGYTRPERAKEFLEKTEVDLIVPNVGTEHRTSAAGRAEYRKEVALAVREAVGNRLVLHGSSCLRDDQFEGLAADGFVRVNMWTGLERVGGVAVAKDILDHLGDVLPGRDRLRYVRQGILAEPQGDLPDLGSLLDRISETHRRDDVWLPSVTDYLADLMKRFGYADCF